MNAIRIHLQETRDNTLEYRLDGTKINGGNEASC